MINKVIASVCSFAFISASVWAMAIAPGVDYRDETLAGAKGNAHAYIIDVAPGSAYVVKPVLGNVSSVGLSSVRATAATIEALAAVNASYFVTGQYAPGEIIGLLKIDGKMTSAVEMHGQERGALGISPAKSPDIGLAKYHGRAQFSGGASLKIDRLNFVFVAGDAAGIYNNADTTVLFNGMYGMSTPTNASWMEYIVENGKVTAIHPGPSPIPVDGYVLSVHGQAAKLVQTVSYGERVQISQTINEQLDEYPDVIGAGPILVRHGVAVSTIFSTIEQFPGDIVDSSAPRTAVGLTADGHILLVVVDGRQIGYSEGLYLSDLANYMIKLGCVQALNLDGGGSSTMVVKGAIVNSPSDKAHAPFSGTARSVGDILAVVKKATI